MLPSEVSAKLVLDQSGLSSQTWTGFQWLYPPAFWTKDTLQRSMNHKIKNISESNKDLCANALRRKNRTHWICEEWSVLSTCEWHTGMRQLDAPRHNLGHSPSNFIDESYTKQLNESKWNKQQTVEPQPILASIWCIQGQCGCNSTAPSTQQTN